MGLQYLEMPNKLRCRVEMSNQTVAAKLCLSPSAGLGYYIQDQCIHQTEKGFSIAKLNIMFSATVSEKTPAEHTPW